MRLILASSSPRRQELLRNAGFDFEVRASKAEGVPCPGEKPEEFARRAAREKALDAAASSPPGSLVLGADTVVDVNGEIFGKPLSLGDAERMLRCLSDITHRVTTGVCLVCAPDHIEALNHETTLVTFRKLDDEVIRSYIQSGEPFDKAGAYAIQGQGSRFVTRISGCHFNVVGLPVPLVYEILKPFLEASG